MEYIIIGFAVVIWLGLLIFLGVKLLDERIEHRGYKWTAVGSIFLALTVAFMAYATTEEAKECEENGGQMVKTGTQTTFIHSGNALIPMTTDTHDCSK